MTVVPYEPWHLLRLEVQPAQDGQYATSDEYAETLAQGRAWTALDEQGHPVACGGFYYQWPGRALAWSLVSLRANLLPLTRAISKIMEEHAPARAEAWVDVDFAQGIRWLSMLGFAHEGRMARFTPEGRDMHLFARVK